jgi:putative phosphoesterase
LSFSFRLIYSFAQSSQAEEVDVGTMLKRVGVLSDTHLRRVTKDFAEIVDRHLSDTDIILHAGDYVSYEVVRFLSKRNFHGVHGNMDALDIKETLPEKVVIEVGPWKVGLIHGWGPSKGLEERIWTEFQSVDVIVYGHAHRVANHWREGVLLFNPGTATGYNPSGSNSLGILEFGDAVRGEIIDIA